MIFPGGRTADKIRKVGKREFFHEPLYGYLAADAAVAVNDHFFISRNFCYPLCDLTQRDELSAEVKILMLPGLSYIDQLKGFAGIEFLFEGLGGNGTHGNKLKVVEDS